jgi:hypothetical protein
MKPVVFSIHGMRNPGKWQRGARAVLEPFFDYQILRYGEFEHFALFKVAGDVIFALLVVLLLTAACRMGMIHSCWIVAGVAVAAAIPIKLLNESQCKRVSGVALRIHGQIRAGMSGMIPPSIIAYSLGTYLMAYIMDCFQGLSLWILILDGCVVTRRYPWSEIRSRFRHVFNEIGGLDWVPLFAGLLRVSMPPMGAAGAHGFTGNAVTARTLHPSQVWPVWPAAKSPCCGAPHHGPNTKQTKVHNIRFPRMNHYDYHKSLDHAWRFWLPRLLNMDPVLYRQFYEDCGGVHAERDPVEYRNGIKEIKGNCYGWRTLEEFAREQVFSIRERRDSEMQVNDLVNGSIAILCEKTTESVERLKNSPPPHDDKLWDYLDPRAAMRHSVASMIEAAIRAGIIPE